MYGRISAAPSAQLRPTASGRAWRTECQNAPTVCPDRMRPEASVTVPETITGRRSPLASISSSSAKIAALALSVSNTVSTRNRSTPPSSKPSACSRYASRSSSKWVLRAPGSLTSGLMLAVRGVGPSAPATKRGLAGVAAASAASRARRAAARFISRASGASA